MKNPPKRPAETLPADPLDDLSEDDPGSMLEQAAAELVGGGGGTIRIERMRPGGKWEFVDEWGAEVFSLRELQQTFGGGEYLLRLRDAQRRYRKQGRILIAEPPKADNPAAAAAADPIAAALAKQTELLSALLAKLSAPPPVDPRASLLDDLVKFKQIIGGERSGGGGNNFKDAMDMVRSAMEFSNQMSSGSTSGWDVVKEAIAQAGGPIARAVEAAAQSVRARAPAAPSSAPASPAALASASAPEIKPEGGVMQIPPRYVAMLVEKAVEESDPALYADLIIDNVPEAMIREVLKGGIVTVLSAIDARVRDRAQWFEQLGAVLGSALEDEPIASQSGGAAATSS